MIHPQSFTKEWLQSHREKPGYERIDPQLVEKMIHALSLVEQLSLQGLNFVFKGGTSLILLLDEAGRFSIDIDIITTASREVVERVLVTICSTAPFLEISPRLVAFFASKASDRLLHMPLKRIFVQCIYLILSCISSCQYCKGVL